MKVFSTIAELIEHNPVAVWVDTDGASGFIYDHEDKIEEHGTMGAAGDSSAPSGTESFLIEHVGRDETLTASLAEAGIAYESN